MDLPVLEKIKTIRKEPSFLTKTSRSKLIYKRLHLQNAKQVICNVKYDEISNLLELNFFYPETCNTNRISFAEGDDLVENLLNGKHIKNVLAFVNIKEILSTWVDFILKEISESNNENLDALNTKLNSHPNDHASDATNLGLKSLTLSDYKGAVSHFSRAISLKGCISDYFNKGEALVKLNKCHDAVSEYKKIIKIGKEMKRIGIENIPSELIEEDYSDPSLVIAKSFEKMGEAYASDNQFNRALNAFTLSLHEMDDKRVKLLMNEILEKSGLTSSRVDIEDLLSNTLIKKKSNSFTFSCTGCGECCRSSDYIQLSPSDIWRMTRSENSVLRGISSTHELRINSPNSIHFTLARGIPVAFLRPIKNTDIGHCHFAFPLYKNNSTGKILSYSEYRIEKLDEKEKMHQKLQESDELPIDTSEYNLTEDEEKVVLESIHLYDNNEEGDDDDDDEDIKECDDEKEEYKDKKSNFEKIFNSYGNPALGCVFGSVDMPSICATYPLARESAFVDFWHDYENEKQSIETPLGKKLEEIGIRNEEDEDHEKYVIVKAAKCEGFTPTIEGNTRAWDNNNDIVTNVEEIDEDDSTITSENTVQDFISNRKLESRWSSQDDFISLINTSQVASSRILKSWERTWAIIVNLTTLLCQDTKKFAKTAHFNSDGAREIYINILLKRGIIN